MCASRRDGLGDPYTASSTACPQISSSVLSYSGAPHLRLKRKPFWAGWTKPQGKEPASPKTKSETK